MLKSREIERYFSRKNASTREGEVFSLGPDQIVDEGRQKGGGVVMPSASTEDSGGGSLRASLSVLAKLIANVTEAYTCAIFSRDSGSESLFVGGAHTLSRDFRWDTRIPLGAGLVGWTAQNGSRVSVSPFENDSTTLLYYSSDQSLKSFVAVPIIGANRNVVGVIACDSKKNYAFATVIEKILYDFSAQAAILLSLWRRVEELSMRTHFQVDVLREAIDRLRTFEDEKSLLTAAAEIPVDLVQRDALVVMTLAEGGVGPGAFYTAPGQSRVSHRLFDLVCRHKLLISRERSVHALPTDDIKQRSFLSVPFHCLGKEAGSYNLLSRPGEAFSDIHIQVVEQFANVVGRELERIRLRERFIATTETNGVESWKQFALTAKAMLRDGKLRRQPMALIRLCMKNLREIEDLIGLDGTVVVMQKIMRLLEQVVRQPSATCYLYGFQILVLTGAGEAGRTVSRLRNLLGRLTPADLMTTSVEPNIGRVILSGLVVVSAAFPTDGENLEQLVARTTRLLDSSLKEKPMEFVANAGSWL